MSRKANYTIEEKVKAHEELDKSIYQTLNYYVNEYPQMRFKGLIVQYPITPN